MPFPTILFIYPDSRPYHVVSGEEVIGHKVPAHNVSMSLGTLDIKVPGTVFEIGGIMSGDLLTWTSR